MSFLITVVGFIINSLLISMSSIGPSWSYLWFSCVLDSDRHWSLCFVLSLCLLLYIHFIVIFNRRDREALCAPNIFSLLEMPHNWFSLLNPFPSPDLVVFFFYWPFQGCSSLFMRRRRFLLMKSLNTIETPTLRKHAYSNILKISPPKKWKFSDKKF